MENPYEGPAIRGQEENTENRVKNIINTSVFNDTMPIEEGQKQSYLYFSNFLSICDKIINISLGMRTIVNLAFTERDIFLI